MGDLVEVEENGVVIFGPGEIDERKGAGGWEDGAMAAALELQAAVVVEAELGVVERRDGAARAVGLMEAAAALRGWIEVR